MEELDPIEVVETFTADGIEVPAGQTGTIVHKFESAEDEFLVEFALPEGNCVLHVYGRCLRPAQIS